MLYVVGARKRFRFSLMGKRKGKGQEPFTKKQKIDQNVNATSNTGWKKRLDSPKGITIPTVPVVLSHSAVQSKSHFEKGNTKDNHSTAQKTIASTVPSSVPSSAPNAVPNTGQGSSKRKRNRKKKGKGAILSNTDGNLSMDQVKEVQVEPKEIKVIVESVKTPAPDEPSESKEAQIEAQVMDAYIKKKKSKKKKKKQSEEKVEDVAIETVAKDDGKVDKKKDKETVKFELEQTPETKVSTYTQYEAPPRPKFTKDDSDQVLRDYLNSQDLNPIVWVYINRLESHIRNLNEKVKTAMDETISLQEHWEKSKRLVTCQVCLELFTNPQVIECGHSFCYSCIKSWIEQNKDDNGSCPTCRNALTQKPQLNVGLEQFVHVDWVDVAYC
jgi:hypothetical protein